MKKEEIKIKQKERAEEYRKNQEFSWKWRWATLLFSWESQFFGSAHWKLKLCWFSGTSTEWSAPKLQTCERRCKICKIPILSDHDRTEKYHLSEKQAQNAICVVANTMFGRSLFGAWKPYTEGHKVDCNTLPTPANTRFNEAVAETAVLHEITEEIMRCDNKSAVIYSYRK